MEATRLMWKLHCNDSRTKCPPFLIVCLGYAALNKIFSLFVFAQQNVFISEPYQRIIIMRKRPANKIYFKFFFPPEFTLLDALERKFS